MSSETAASNISSPAVTGILDAPVKKIPKDFDRVKPKKNSWFFTCSVDVCGCKWQGQKQDW